MGSILGIELGPKLGSRLGTELGRRIPKLDFKLGTVLEGRHRTEVVLDINLDSKLGTVFDREPILVDIKLELKAKS
jgi:hypothetical protein